MTLVVGEDTFVSLTDANTYHSDRASSVWTSTSPTNPVKEAALRYSAAWLEGVPWKGVVSTDAQEMTWPRVYYDEYGHYHDDTPQEILDAQCEMAVHHVSSALNKASFQTGSMDEVKVGPIEVKFGSATFQRDYPFVWRLIRRFVSGSSVSRPLVKV